MHLTGEDSVHPPYLFLSSLHPSLSVPLSLCLAKFRGELRNICYFNNFMHQFIIISLSFFFAYTQHFTIFSWILSGKHQILPSFLLLSLWHKETYWCASSSPLQRKMYWSEPFLQWLSLFLLVFLVPHLLGFTVHQQ